jgi:hypothetical protein
MGPRITKIALCFSFKGKPGDSYRYWAPFAFDIRDIRMNPTVLPPNDDLLRLLEAARDRRPKLNDFTYHIECGIWPDGQENGYNAMCSFKFPEPQDDGFGGEEEVNRSVITRFPISNKVARLEVWASGVHRMCPVPREVLDLLGVVDGQAQILDEIEADEDRAQALDEMNANFD